MEAELENLLIECKQTPENQRNYTPIYDFFKKVVSQDKKIQVTESLSKLIGFLSMIDDGLLWPIAKETLVGFQQSMIVPPLQISQHAFTPKRPRRIQLSARPKVIPRSFKITAPTQRNTLKTVTYLKPMTDRDILPKLVFAPEKSLYFCQPKAPQTARVPSSLSYNIRRKKNPIEKPDNDVKTLTLNGLFTISKDKTGEFMPLNNFLSYKESVYMTQQLPVFQNWTRNKAFIKWRSKLRMLRHQRNQHHINETCPFEGSTFIDVYMRIRKTIFTVFQTCHPISSDMPTDSFENLKINSEQSIENMRRQMQSLTEQISADLEHFFDQIRGIAVLIRSDYEILKRIGALPASLLPFAIQDDTICPSITALKERNQILLHERTLAHERKEYLVKFFHMIRLFMRDFTSGQLAVTLSELYSRFYGETNSASNLVNLLIDEEKGIRMSPTVDDFTDWFTYVDQKIWTIFLTYTIELSPEATFKLFDNGDGTVQENPIIRAERDTIMQPEITAKKDRAAESIKQAYDFFEERLVQPREFFLSTMARIAEIRATEGYEQIDDFVNIMSEMKEMRAKIENQSRLITCGAFYADMKLAKISLMKLLNDAMDGTKEIGIEKAQTIYEEIQDHRKRYLAETSKAQSNTPQEAKIKKEILNDIQKSTTDFMTIMTSLQSNWSEGLADLSEKLELVKEIHAFAQNALKKKKIKRKVKKPKETQVTPEN